MIAALWSTLLVCTLLAREDSTSTLPLASLQLHATRVNCTVTPTTGGRLLVAGGLADQAALVSAHGDAELLDPRWSDGLGRVSGPIPFASRVFAARAFHDAVALPRGRVLLVGGDVGGTLEIFDPAVGARGEFRVVGSLRHGPRFGLTATLLADGRVFVAGGLFVNQKPTAKTEIFDFATGECTSGPNLLEARNSHTATLLPDGRVLLTGGVAKKSTELFDPKTGAITRGPDMLACRDDHRATLLPDGRLLITAGQDERARVQRSCEILDVAAATSTAIGSLREARGDHAQVLLPDGSVLVVGGEDDAGDDADRILDSIERFDPKTRSFTPCGRLGVPRDDCAAVVLDDGRVVIVGGQTTGDVALSSIEFFKP